MSEADDVRRRLGVAALGPVPTAVTAKGVGRVDGKTVSALLRQRLSGLSEPTPEAEP